jgi:hypothetical protein
MRRACYVREVQLGYRQTPPSFEHNQAYGRRGLGSFARGAYNKRPRQSSEQKGYALSNYRRYVGEQGSGAIVLHDEEDICPTESSQLKEGAVVIGSVSCKLSSELHING